MFQNETQIQDGILTFLAHFLMTQQFFMTHLFMPPSKEMESLCHPPLCHLQNSYATIFMPPWGWYKKRGGGHKKENNTRNPLNVIQAKTLDTFLRHIPPIDIV